MGTVVTIPPGAGGRDLERRPGHPAAKIIAHGQLRAAPRRPGIRHCTSAAGVLILGLIVNGAVHSGTTPGGGCPGLAQYTAKPYATAKGERRRCDLLREIEGDGEVASEPLRARVLQELANRFAVEMDFTGSVALPGRAVDYLLENMPETAALVSAYADKEYQATQTDGTPGPKSFFVTNGASFAARFTFLSSRTSPDVSEHMFFESGHADVLFWRVWGSSFVRYHLHKDGDKSARYDIRVHVFTDSRLLRAVLGSRLFRYFADRMFKGILNDIESAVRRFAGDSDPREQLPSYFVTGLNARLEGDSIPPPAR